MDTITKLNNLFIKGWINEEEYKNLINKHTKDNSSTDKIKKMLNSMSIEELLDTYDKAETKAEKKTIKLLIMAELEKRIGK